MSRTIVISAVNLRKGGTLSILQECLSAMSELAKRHEWRVVALVHRKELAFYEGIEYIEIPWSVRSWAHRLWCEYVTMHGISRRLSHIDLWLSLHDTTPRVVADNQIVYCHNSYPFFKWHWRHLWQNYKIVCFALFTRWFYRINLHRNRLIVVQQEWFREAFAKMFHLPFDKIVVFPPGRTWPKIPARTSSDGIYRFIYPAFPDVHKNFECLCEAARLLEQEVGQGCFEVLLTTSPSFNRYSKWLHRRWGNVSSLHFGGFLGREQLLNSYAQADCLVFPSHVETWGLPISEFAATERPMLLADLAYAHESAAGCSEVAFFDPDKPVQLKQLMLALLRGDKSNLAPVKREKLAPPTAANWKELIEQIYNKA